MSHAPVMLDEMLHVLAPRDGGFYIDATFGAGGYSRAILAEADCRVLAIDRDTTVRAAGDMLKAAAPGRFVLAECRFSEMDALVRENGGDGVDGVVMDVGVSSMQLDRPERGFSFRADGPLDMRMGRGGPTAGDVVASLGEAELEAILRAYGEEKKARRIAAAIARAREHTAIASTAALSRIVEDAVGPGDGRIHPATRAFQALRIYVNDELGELTRGLAAAERILRPGGRLIVVSFHSLEDRIVKSFLRKRSGMEGAGSRHLPAGPAGPAPSFTLAFSGARMANEAEVADNPRARSAKLRAGERTDAPAWEEEDLAPTVSVRPITEAAL
ncbi:MAG: 16S rRNA (cytosine(1402)-N(4))-methyltransferase RsmH [Caulobacterales bacterium]|nr:16S rRNA (cytosine(1402)-N(4))-methyltransferase RsmH [Caulobacterales bacterium]